MGAPLPNPAKPEAAPPGDTLVPARGWRPGAGEAGKSPRGSREASPAPLPLSLHGVPVGSQARAPWQGEGVPQRWVPWEAEWSSEALRRADCLQVVPEPRFSHHQEGPVLPEEACLCRDRTPASCGSRVPQEVVSGGPGVQAGFRKGRGTRDQIANIRWIIEKAREFQKSIYFCFTDYTEAFDSVDHNKLENSWRWKHQTTLPAS